MGKRSAGKQIRSKHDTQVESLEKRQLLASDLGININEVNAGNYKAIVENLVASGTKSVRLWYGFSSYQTRELAPVTKYAQKFHNDGFNVTLAVNPDKGRRGTPEETRGLFEFLATQPELKDSVDLWELGNEPDAEKYWRGTLSEFVSDFIAPASRVLHNMGEKVVNGGVAWNPKDIKELVDAGMLKYVDMVGYHPYRSTVRDLKAKIAEVKSYVGDMPLVATEWNIRGFEKSGNYKAWASGIKDFWPVIRDNFAISHYFVMTVMDSLAGPAGILETNGRANEPFYSTYMSLQDGRGSPGNGGEEGEEGEEEGGGSETPKPTPEEPKPEKPKPTKPKPTPAPENEEPEEEPSEDGDSDGSNGSGGSKSDDDDKPSRPGRGGGNSNDRDDDDSDGAGSKPDDKKPTKKPAKPSTDGDDDASDGAGSKGDDKKPTKKPVRRPIVATPTTPRRPSTGTVAEPTTPSAPPVVVNPPALSSISLLNAARDRVIKPYGVLSGVNTIDLATAGTAYLSLLASGNKKTGSVVWTMNGNTVVDSDGVFTMFGEKNGDLVGNLFEAGRSYVLTAQPFSGEAGTGVAGELSVMSINVIDSSGGTAVTGRSAAEEEARRRRAERDVRVNGPVVIPGL